MTAHIEIRGTAGRFSEQVRSLVDNTRNVQNNAIKTKDIMDQIASGGDWASLATYLGLSGDDVEADAETVYNLIIAFANAISNVGVVDSLIDRLG